MAIIATEAEIQAAIESTFRVTLNILNEHFIARPLDTPITLSFDLDGLAEPIKTQSNLYAALCVSLYGANRLDWSWGLGDVFSSLNEDTFQIIQNGLAYIGDIFQFLEKNFDGTLPDVPADLSDDDVLIDLLLEEFTQGVRHTFYRQHNIRRPTESIDALSDVALLPLCTPSIKTVLTHLADRIRKDTDKVSMAIESAYQELLNFAETIPLGSLCDRVSIQFDVDGLPEPMAFELNRYALLCALFYGSTELDFSMGLMEILESASDSTFCIEQNGLTYIPDIFRYLKETFDTSTPEVPADLTQDATLIEPMKDVFAHAAGYSYLRDNNLLGQNLPPEASHERLMALSKGQVKKLLGVIAERAQ